MSLLAPMYMLRMHNSSLYRGPTRQRQICPIRLASSLHPSLMFFAMGGLIQMLRETFLGLVLRQGLSHLFSGQSDGWIAPS